MKPCPCECNSGGFCGGCGHAGCSGGINLAKRVISADEAGVQEASMMAPHGHPDHKCSQDFVYEMRFTGEQLQMIRNALIQELESVKLMGPGAVLAGVATPEEVLETAHLIIDTCNQIGHTVEPRIKEQLRREAVWEEFNVRQN